eukprot:COSAG04_NODE_5146_length_1720_cov_7.023442_2_plen_211_part_00
MDEVKAFFIQWKWSDEEKMTALMEFFLRYVSEGTKYLIGKEKTTDGTHFETGGEHIHFCVEWDPKQYHRFAVAVKQKFNLRGKPVAGFPSQMKAVIKLRNYEKMCAYTVKDGNIITNYTPVELARWKTMSYKKAEKEDIKAKLIEHVKVLLDDGEGFESCRRAIVEWHFDNHTEWNLTRSSIDGIIMKAFYKANIHWKTEMVLQQLYGQC